MTRVAVVAVGGNALIPDEAHESARDQFDQVARTTTGIVDMIADGWTVVITHGNGPQVGFVMRRSELSMKELPPLPMDYADANTQGVIGYMFQRALGNEFTRRGIDRSVVTVVTQVVVHADDPAMKKPTKPIGSFLNDQEADEARDDGWTLVEDAGRGRRRVVPSPLPQHIVELDAVRTLVDRGFIAVACGGGGIPVYRDATGQLCGLRAVIDKDMTASLLARELRADLLLISTAVDRVALDFGKPEQRWLDRVCVEELRARHDRGEFAEGSMAPKVRAVLEFLEAGGKHAVITDPAHIFDAVAGRAGTTVALIPAEKSASVR